MKDLPRAASALLAALTEFTAALETATDNLPEKAAQQRLTEEDEAVLAFVGRYPRRQLPQYRDLEPLLCAWLAFAPEAPTRARRDPRAPRPRSHRGRA